VSAGATAAARPRLQCQDVAVRFGGVVAVGSVSLVIPPASIVGLIGPNGAGKSTLFSVLSGLRRPNGGTVQFEGTDITRASVQHRARLGLARTFQHPEIFSGLTVREHVILADRVSTRRTRIWSDMVTARGFRRADAEEGERVNTLLPCALLGSRSSPSRLCRSE
jgi:branched-chain amino acid transport system ATP-binding protein